jgi:ribosomal protein S18 acetylase RimI-like enzyme
MTVRTATPADAKAVAALVSVAYRIEDFFKIGDRTDEHEVLELMKTGAFLILEDEHGTMAGCVSVDVHDETGHFGMLSVDPARQGQGLGRLLIDAVERFCREAGCRTMEIEVVNLRTELPGFYRRYGYVEAGTRPFPLNERTRVPCHYIVMTKPL